MLDVGTWIVLNQVMSLFRKFSNHFMFNHLVDYNFYDDIDIMCYLKSGPKLSSIF